MAGAPNGFGSVAEAAQAVRAYLPHRPPPADDAGLRRNLRRRGDRWVWHWDPRLLDDMGNRTEEFGATQAHLDAVNARRIPTLLVRGALSDVLSDEIADEFCRLVPHAERVDVNGAAHMVAGDRNDRFLDAVLPFLARLASDE
jgi:pimeloyl-ACP methyl ester carboxylesterase